MSQKIRAFFNGLLQNLKNNPELIGSREITSNIGIFNRTFNMKSHKIKQKQLVLDKVIVISLVILEKSH